MEKIIDVHSFLDNKNFDIDERCAMWCYSVYAFTERWELVLEAKWKLASLWQGDIPNYVKPLEVIEYESDCVGC